MTSYDETPPNSRNALHEEGTDRFDPMALNHVFDVVDRLRKAGGFTGLQDAWYDEVCPSCSVPLSHNPSQAASDRGALENALRMKEILTSSADALGKVQELISRQLKKCEEDIEIYRRRRGFFIIPDEIMVSVLEFAAIDERRGLLVTGETVRSSIRLSHVCKRFRDLVTSSPILWRNISNLLGNINIVTLLLSRCKRHNAEVTLYNYLFGGLDNTSFIFAMMEVGENVESFVVEGNLEERFPLDRLEDEVDEQQPDDYHVLSYFFHFPHLTKISIRYPRSAMLPQKFANTNIRNSMHFYSSWKTPRLRSLSARQFIPVPFSGTQSITALDIELGSDHRRNSNTPLVGLDLDVKSLVAFLSACYNLQEIKLDIEEASNVFSFPTPGVRAEMQHVSKIQLDVIYCRGSVIKILFDALLFPSVNKMNLFMRTVEEDEKPDEHFRDVFRAILSNANAFPNLTEMTLEVCVEAFIDSDRGHQHGTISIPLDVMPKLRTLQLNAGLSSLSPIPEGMQLPPIRTLSVLDCYKRTRSWVRSFLRRMEAQGRLDDVQVDIRHFFKASEGNNGFHGILTKEVVRELAEP